MSSTVVWVSAFFSDNPTPTPVAMLFLMIRRSNETETEYFGERIHEYGVHLFHVISIYESVSQGWRYSAEKKRKDKTRSFLNVPRWSLFFVL